ncbi:hypothetical protein RFI_01345 [Reticulomyxa filosa]|uniref:Uncharacterized protein n=1 Tax=Reticulomyxa filosa TaxID=46433 RepID=X6PDH0_RETFI|nr:hypothetical protein RFI_01345 [Reticulomyxa filosa]|eukprot:ETO35717.1 hypothetical protein RFI_01345 [Reticulomyxa filosa]
MHSSTCSEEKKFETEEISKKQTTETGNDKDAPTQPREYLFDESCIYSLLEVFLIQFGSKEEKRLFYKWFWLFERDAGLFVICFFFFFLKKKKGVQAFCTFQKKKKCTKKKGAHYRIILIPMPDFHMFEVRIDSLHGIPSNLEQQLYGVFNFEYYYAYCYGHHWGGWKLYEKTGRCVANQQYNWTSKKPPQMWKNVMWIRQIEMELRHEQNKYMGIHACYTQTSSSSSSTTFDESDKNGTNTNININTNANAKTKTKTNASINTKVNANSQKANKRPNSTLWGGNNAFLNSNEKNPFDTYWYSKHQYNATSF